MTDTTSGAKPPSSGEDEKACPKCGRKSHDKKYRRSKSERKKALLRDAPTLPAKARKFIEQTGGDNVPPGYEVSHDTPLATKPHSDRCELDTADNMETLPKDEHRKLHMECGDTYHLHGPLN